MNMTPKALARAALAPALLCAPAACVTTENIYLENDCYRITSSDLQVDCEAATWSVSGFCVQVLHPACDDIDRAEIRIGADVNGNGAIDDDESSVDVDLPGPSDMICSGNLSGNTGEDGVPMLLEVRVWVDGQDNPIYSETEKIG